MTVGSSVPQFVYEGTLTFSAVASSTTLVPEQTVTLPTGVQLPSWGANGGMLHLNLPNLQAGLIVSNPYAVSATTFKIRFYNPTGGSLTPLGTGAKLIMF